MAPNAEDQDSEWSSEDDGEALEGTASIYNRNINANESQSAPLNAADLFGDDDDDAGDDAPVRDGEKQGKEGEENQRPSPDDPKKVKVPSSLVKVERFNANGGSSNATNLERDLFGDDDYDLSDNDSGSDAQGKQVRSESTVLHGNQTMGDLNEEDEDDYAAGEHAVLEHGRSPEEAARSTLEVTLLRLPPLQRPRSDTDPDGIMVEEAGSEGFMLAKLPTFLHIDPEPFDPDTYEEESVALLADSSTDAAAAAEGRRGIQLQVENTIRCRRNPETNLLESNARVVTWSNGTQSLVLGQEIFDMGARSLDDEHHHHEYVYLHQYVAGNVFQCEGRLKSSVSFRPATLKSVTHKKLTATVLAKHQKTTKTKLFVSLKNPEQAKLEAERLEADKLKLQRKLEQQRKRSKTSRSGWMGLSEQTLEEEEDDFWEEANELDAVKSSSKRTARSSKESGKRPRPLDDGDDEEYDDEMKDFVVDGTLPYDVAALDLLTQREMVDDFDETGDEDTDEEEEDDEEDDEDEGEEDDEKETEPSKSSKNDDKASLQESSVRKPASRVLVCDDEGGGDD